MLIPYNGHTPQIGHGVFIAHNATIIGNVHIADNVSIWFGAIIRADHGAIHIGAGSNIQDNAVIHLTHSPPYDTILHQNVTIGHGAVLEGCTIEAGALIGINAVILPLAVIGAGSVIAAGSVVTERTHIPPGVLAAGSPATVKKQLSGRALDQATNAPVNYQRLKNQYPTAAGTYYE